MTKRRSTSDLTLAPRDPSVPSYRWLYAALREEILSNRLTPGTRLPATRDLAQQYGLSRGTIVSAFEMLQAEGYLDADVGRGTFVSTAIPTELLESRTLWAQAPGKHQSPARRFSEYARRVAPRLDLEPVQAPAFRPNAQALDLFPKSLWAKIAADRYRRIAGSDLRGCGALGYEPLRIAIAQYLTMSRGVKCDWEQVIIVSGVQDALDLAARLFVDPGDPVCIEYPGYHGAESVFNAYGAKLIRVPVDDEGMESRESDIGCARLGYVTPSHQYPLGITMSLSRRLQLLDCVRNKDTLIFEDDYDSEFRYTGKPVSALQGLDGGKSVLFAGSFSKVLFPSLRLGYLVVPTDVIARFEAAKAASIGHVPLLDQAILCEFIEQGHFTRHVRRMREMYGERLAAFMASARTHLDGLLAISGIEAGLQVFGWLAGDTTAESASRKAAQHGIEVWPVSVSQNSKKARHGLQIGFGQLTASEIEQAMPHLAAALEDALV